jgi:DNA-binding response OmpR family regulator
MIRLFSAAALSSDVDASAAISIVVIDPRFDAYQSLATAAKLGRCSLHFRASGRDALHLLSKRRVEAVIVGEELDDMTGRECVALLRARHDDASPGTEAPVVLMAAAAGSERGAHPAGGCDATFSRPITISDVEDQVRIRRRGRGVVRIPALLRAMTTLPVGVCAAAASIAALLLM